MAAGVRRKKRRLGLATQVFIGLGLGIFVAVFFGEEAAFLKTGGDAFIALLQITVIPYVVVALITSLGRLTLDDATSLGIKAGSVLLVLWAVGLVVVLASPLALPDWPSATFFSTSQIEEAPPVDFLSLYIPANIFSSLANAIVPAIVVFSILFGLALIDVTRKDRVLELLSSVGDTLVTITGFVGKLAPYGVFAITASAAGTIDVADLGRLQVYLVLYVAVALILSFWVVPGLIATLTPLAYGDVLRAFRGPLITAFATGNVLIVLPVLAADSKELLARATASAAGEPDEEKQSSIDILIPAAFPFPNLGAILALMFVLFGGWFVGSPVDVAQYPSLAAAGLASLFGGTVLALPFLFDLLRLPADLFQVFVTVDVIGSRFGTLLAAMHIVAVALIGTYALQGAVRLRLFPLLRFAVLSVTLIGVTFFGIRAFYTFVYVVPFTKGDLLNSLRLGDEAQPHTVYREPPAMIADDAPGKSSLERVTEQGTLRVCYQLDDYPSSFFNKDDELVGFDIALTHQFARVLQASIDFLPVRSIAEAGKRINTPYCDVLMSLIPIVPELIDRFLMTSPVLDGAVGLIVSDHRRREFQDWDSIAHEEGLRIAVPETRASLGFLTRRLPNATAIVLDDKAALDSLLAAGLPNADAVLSPAEEGAAWTIRYPRFSLVTPAPTLFVPFGFAVGRDDADLLLFLDTWLLNAKGDGTIDRLYDYWMLGRVRGSQPPRWSIIRNVFHWIE